MRLKDKKTNDVPQNTENYILSNIDPTKQVLGEVISAPLVALVVNHVKNLV